MPETAVATAERTLPHNLEAERSVLGAILVHNDAFNMAAQVIDSNDFFRDAHRRIFDKMVALNERSQAIDFVTLKEELARSGDIDAIGGPAYEAEQEPGLILDEAESAIFAVADDRLKAGFVPMATLVKENFPKIEQLFE